MNSSLITLLAWLIVTMSFVALWALAREKLKTTQKNIKTQQRIIEDLKSEYARAVEEAGHARAIQEHKQVLAMQKAEAEHVHAIQAAEERIAKISERYSGIISQDEEIARLKQEAADIAVQIELVRNTYAEKRQTLGRLEEQVAIYDERLAFAELGVYEPHFDFGDSEDFKKRILEVRERQKAMISSKIAALCPTDWAVEGSKSKGQIMINR